MTHPSLVYPAPSLVVGMGRFGLAVLERLGEDWKQLRLSGADQSLRNLRLIWLHSQGETEDCWRQEEEKELRIARYIKDGDLPTIALDFVALRTLGLIRYHHGAYQIAVPQDRGPVRVSDLLLEGSDRRDSGQHDGDREDPRNRKKEAEQFVRRRFFDWQDLDPDPLHAAEILRRKAERESPLHQFIAPLINRIRQGHSPWILLAAIQRCSSLASGRDPAPWRWVRQALSGHPPGPTSIPAPTIDQARQQHRDYDKLLDSLAPPALSIEGKHQEVNYNLSNLSADPLDGNGWEFAESEIIVPANFHPASDDPETPIDPFHLLNEDWQATGWATDLEEENEQPFKTLRVSHFRLGLFDHSATAHSEEKSLSEHLGQRLRLLADLLHKGLVRLWVDLKREQVEEFSPLPQLQRHEAAEEALQQSLKMLDELLIRPLHEEDGGPEQDHEQEAGPRDIDLLADRPTRFLRSLIFDPEPRAWEESALERRLAALGLADSANRPPAPRSLLQQVAFCRHEQPRDSLRKVLNREVRDLLDFSYLAEYRKKATRTPPRLTVFVVGDMSEPFARQKMTEVLRDIHSELLRSFSSMFELHREGFDRALSVVPILWMPHPADPFGGEPLEKTRLEEAAIIDSVHRVRRWVESVLPGSRRRISQIFINGRVTDNAVLTLRDSIQQTRDFLSFQIRNDLSRDDWLRRTAVGPGGDDLFASFACCEIEFPAERAREYLANRLVRECLHRLRGEPSSESPKVARSLAPPAKKELVEAASSDLEENTKRRARRLLTQVWEALPGKAKENRCLSRRQVLDAFDDAFEQRLWQGVLSLWRDLTQRCGRMDALIDDLRCQVSVKLHQTLPEIRQDSDNDIHRVSDQGLPAMLSRIGDRRREAFAVLQQTEKERRRNEQNCQRHRAPSRRQLQHARDEVVVAAENKPDCGPQRLGVTIWVLLLPATSALPVAGLASSLGEFWALLASAGVTTVLASGLLRLHTRYFHRRLRACIEMLENSVQHLVAGSDGTELQDQQPSLRSFFEMRLQLTAALARRGYALHTYQQAATDEGLGQRLRESIDIQQHCMLRRAEELGVRPAPPGSQARDDLRDIFVRRVGERMAKLIDPNHLMEYYRSRVRPNELPVVDFLDQSGGLSDWRKTASLSDTESLMGYGRELFATVANHPITELDYFSEVVGKHLQDFVRRNYSNLGFGAKFLGYEGLDPDGVRLAADASLVADGPLLAAYDQVEEEFDSSPRDSRDLYHQRPRSLDRLMAGIRPNAAYMFSLVQGVRAHSVHNLKRFESFHDRSVEGSRNGQAIHLLSGNEVLGMELLKKIRKNQQPSSDNGDLIEDDRESDSELV